MHCSIRFVKIIGLLLCLLFLSPEFAATKSRNSTDVIPGAILPELSSIGYSGTERLVYDVSWTGGIKIGELHLQVESLGSDDFQISVRITTEDGAMHYIYPIEDRYVTRVRGKRKLPYFYEAWQKEGYSYTAHKVTRYDQVRGRVIQKKNGKDGGTIAVDGVINNEFSSFFNSRLMEFEVGKPFVVPTFADRKRAEVLVNVVSKKKLDDSSLGAVNCVEIMPVLTFKGLYDKQGDTVIWYTDDECRVPVRIRSKILLGSLTAELVQYSNPACGKYQLDKNEQN